MHTGFWWGNLTETDHLEDSRVDGRIVFKWIKTWAGGHGLNLPGSGEGRWPVIVNEGINLRVA